mmetsp:Transcript_34617/g.106397  ORF Transcript_34617/g.106397 Transcript_34617/m.106397 type:complete len:280 (+) Transcript_34617:184-1023(+)
MGAPCTASGNANAAGRDADAEPAGADGRGGEDGCVRDVGGRYRCDDLGQGRGEGRQDAGGHGSHRPGVYAHVPAGRGEAEARPDGEGARAQGVPGAGRGPDPRAVSVRAVPRRVDGRERRGRGPPPHGHGVHGASPRPGRLRAAGRGARRGHRGAAGGRRERRAPLEPPDGGGPELLVLCARGGARAAGARHGHGRGRPRDDRRRRGPVLQGPEPAVHLLEAPHREPAGAKGDEDAPQRQDHDGDAPAVSRRRQVHLGRAVGRPRPARGRHGRLRARCL